MRWMYLIKTDSKKLNNLTTLHILKLPMKHTVCEFNKRSDKSIKSLYDYRHHRGKYGHDSVDRQQHHSIIRLQFLCGYIKIKQLERLHYSKYIPLLKESVPPHSKLTF